MFAQCDADWFYRHQLSNVLILDHRSSYRRMIQPRRFHGSYTWHTSIEKSALLITESDISFRDDHDGQAHGYLKVGFLR
jgi:hypothetical protein